LASNIVQTSETVTQTKVAGKLSVVTQIVFGGSNTHSFHHCMLARYYPTFYDTFTGIISSLAEKSVYA
jgi:hypothetical protein